MPAVNRKAPNKTHTQSVIFNKKNWTTEKAKSWLKSHSYISKNLDTTDNYYRFRQYDPDEKRFNYRNKVIEKGLLFVIGFLKESKPKD
jgi:hypothetical protein